MRRRLGPLALLALLVPACGEPRLLEGFTEGQTRLRLNPSEFVGSVPCQVGVDGALQTYVALLQEVIPNAPPDAGFNVAYDTGRVACDQSVMFPAVAGRRYGAEIYGFDRELGDEIDLSTARWTSLCGRGRPGNEPSDAGPDPYQPTESERGVTVTLRGCTSFSGEASAPTRLRVDSASALGALRCGSGPGEVYAFEGTLEGETRTALCGSPLEFDAPAPNRYYTIALTGLAAASVPSDAGAPPPADAGVTPLPQDAGSGLDASAATPPGDALDASVGSPGPSPDAGSPAPVEGIPRWQTSCVGRALAGATAPAFCDPLSAIPTAP